jgi:UDP-2,4-diacetamido-2,4,6-trideoxy-beta-L-altropyranose hydrolase
MNTKKIVIRCITEPSKGFGHLSRCLVLAKALRKNKNKIFFVINKNKKVLDLLNKEKFESVIIPTSYSYETEEVFLKKIILEQKCVGIILDMREYGEKIALKLKNNYFKIVSLDDAWIKNVHADVIINGTVAKIYHKYKLINKKSKQYLGPKYWIFSEQFSKNHKNYFDIKIKKKFKVVISIGGSDEKQISVSLIKKLLKYKQINFIVIVGPLFSKISTLKKLSKINPHLSLINNPDKIWNIFKTADLGLIGSGNTLYEFILLGIPTMSISVVKHQLLYGEFFEKVGATKHLGLWSQNTSKIVSNQLLLILNDKSARQKMNSASRKIFDGKECDRVINILEKLF